MKSQNPQLFSGYNIISQLKGGESSLIISDEDRKYISKKLETIEYWCPAYQKRSLTLGINTT